VRGPRTTWEVTSFLLGEYVEEEQRNPVFTVGDGILWLSQAIDRNSVVRKLQVMKTRGRAQMPGLHTFRITDAGLQIFPRIPEQTRKRQLHRRERLSTGVRGLDEMIGSGVISGDAVMLTGPAGSGKSTIATQFMVTGLAKGETGVIAVFEEYPEEYLARANTRNPNVGKMINAGKLELIYLRPLDLSVDEALAAILEAVERLGAKRVVIDSLSGFEVALAPTFRENFRESLYRLVGTLTATGVTVFMTAEVSEGFPDVRFTSEKVSFITDEIIIQRYVEIEGELRRVMAVIKMRGSDHSHEFRTYEVILHRFGCRRDPLHRGRGEERRRDEADAEDAEDNERRCRVQYEAALVGEARKAVTDTTQADAAVGPWGPQPSPRGGERHAPWDALLLQPAHGRHQCQEHRDHHRQHDGPAKPERGDDHQRDDDD